MFGIILISVVTLMHLYVVFRSASVPFIVKHINRKVFWALGFGLWGIAVLGRYAGHDGTGTLAMLLEAGGMIWMAVLFLTCLPLLVVDMVTGFAFLFPRLSPVLRGWALLAGCILSFIALIQGLRPPVVSYYEVALPGMRASMDGTVVVGISDTHIGNQLGADWLASRVEQVNALKPDVIVMLGDMVEGHGSPEPEVVKALKGFQAPLGVFAVTGNHEYHGGRSLSFFHEAGIRLLRDQWIEVAPGLVVAGVDDLTARRRRGIGGAPMARALTGRPPGGVILLSHTPWQAGHAAKEGAGLMLSGHTHGGQIWPFDYLVRLRYALLEGAYKVNGMTAIVCRGTGSWGPRMRLWGPAEILYITLKQKREAVGFSH